MKKSTNTILALALAVPGLAAAAGDADEITMQVIEGDTPETVTRQIELPEAASDEARTQSADGMETASQNRERNRHRNRNREMEQETEEAVRERRREMHEQRQQIQEQQRQMQEQQRQMQQQLQEQQDSTRDSQYRQGQ